MTARDHLSQPVNFGGLLVPLGEAIATLRTEGTPDHLIDRWVQGALVAR
jgi:hypothetical protein